MCKALAFRPHGPGAHAINKPGRAELTSDERVVGRTAIFSMNCRPFNMQLQIVPNLQPLR